MSHWDIIIRVSLAAAMAGAIGYEREQKNRPAGMKTHMLVCIGAATFAILERLLIEESMDVLGSYSNISGSIPTISIGRLVAQVISGIGFLGAGTIIITRRNITGLTTAASIWLVACLGIVVGYGMYALSLIVFVIIMVTLVALKRIIHVHSVKKLEIKYYHRVETKEYILQYFALKGIVVKDVDFSLEAGEGRNIYTNIYTVDMPSDIDYINIVEDLSIYKNMIRIRMISL